MTHRDVLALALVMALAAEAAAGQAQRTGAIGGRVVDARTGTGLARVLVQVEDGGPAAQTDEDGAFLLSGVAPGQRRLFVSVVGFTLVRRDVEVAPGAATTLP